MNIYNFGAPNYDCMNIFLKDINWKELLNHSDMNIQMNKV